MSETHIVLDTSAYAHLGRGHHGVLDWVADADIVYVPATVLGELEAGFLLGSRPDENRRQLEGFLDEPFTEVIPVSPRVARFYGAIFAALRRAGTPIPVNDIWIAAAAKASGAHLITFDADFGVIAELRYTLLA